MSKNELQQILAEYRKGLVEALGDDLDSVLLYGSQARGDARGIDSDIDVLCIMRGPFRDRDLTRRTSELTARLSLENDTVLSRKFVTRDDYETCRLPFYMNARSEGIVF